MEPDKLRDQIVSIIKKESYTTRDNAQAIANDLIAAGLVFKKDVKVDLRPGESIMLLPIDYPETNTKGAWAKIAIGGKILERYESIATQDILKEV